jgi:hypothetical protein
MSNVVQVTLFDFSLDPEKGAPLQVKRLYEGELADEACLRKIVLTVGNVTCCGTLSLPLVVLTEVMGAVMTVDQERAAKLAPVLMPKQGVRCQHNVLMRECAICKGKMN